MSNGPISIESLLQKQKAEKDAAAKPKFLSKEERASIAIAKRAAEIRGQKDRDEAVKRERDALESQIRQRERDNAPPPRGHQNRHNNNSYKSRGPPPANAPTGPRADRNKNSSSSSSMPPPPPPPAAPSTDLPMSQEPDMSTMTSTELDDLRTRYLGVGQKKRKIRKMNDRKFVFDWDATDDTMASAPAFLPIPQNAPKSMFGRGHIAGIDDGGRDAMERRSTVVDERHWSEKPLNEMKERDWRIFREDFSISARGGSIPCPLRSWTESDIPRQLLDCVEAIGYKEPSPIQRQAIPIGLMRRDTIGIAETGSGKTAAFVIPMLSFILSLPRFTDDNRHLGPYALILAPTRELAQQIESETRKFASPLGYRCVSIVGGRAVEEQQFNLREGAEIIIATPGRLKDVIERHVLVLSQCRYVVMDEADRMVHLGFEADLTFILDALPTETMDGEDTSVGMDIDGGAVRKGRTRVTTLFSATMPPAVERLSRKYLKRAAVITIGEAGRAVDTVEQRVEFVNGDEKKRLRLLELLNSGEYPSPIIVFVNQKKTADMVAKDLHRANWNASTLHSGKNQEQREAALQSLRSGESDILVATDLAGRGIDVQDVSLVINYQMANTIEAYVHRIGRTGRAGKLGTAITFLTNEDEELFYDLRKALSESAVSKVPPELARHEASQHKVTRDMKRKREGEED
ncbi:P-loop containing nucleoside triphosphate hydrolase protein [Cylindrobasidium torrendii FP15055 ss-10]|uniref:RNA helicase n=1 Tax=Cylindrobasidium torrendii FP15055 ss-10 TaxID=1314674 RepID=A0A0D7AYI1_9AGAR|nr:P-loop containing nucleoside triphosphate hydrolase protein [Cylindrobasidium torrendii FP15055 ss-10]